jgi:TetR/AcrR family transcriptional regulator, cholesterol catabolism regulator
MPLTRRDEVLRAASELFATHGFHAVGMRAIADAVGIRGSSLYHYFPSKVDLLEAIARESTVAFIELQLADLSPNPSYAARLRKLVHEHVVYFHEHRLEEAVGLRELRELRGQRPEAYAELQKIRRSYQDALQQMITEGRERGEFTCDDPHLTTLALLGMLNSINDWFLVGGRHSIDEVASAYAELTVTRLLGANAEPKQTDSTPLA